jgi:hypothetical protein
MCHKLDEQRSVSSVTEKGIKLTISVSMSCSFPNLVLLKYILAVLLHIEAT